MSNLRVLKTAIACHWGAHRSNPVNFFAGTLGMIVNNVIVLVGLWAMLFQGKPNEQVLTLYFLALNAMVVLAWGGVCFFFGGVEGLARTIENGALEPMLSTPRDPLLLVGISESVLPALGDLLQGSLCLLLLFYLAPFDMALRCLLFVGVSTLAFLGLFILTGSLVFFVRRGSALAYLLLECNLSLSFYPSGKIFSETGRLFLYLTPAAATALLPMRAIETGSIGLISLSFLAAILFFILAVCVFRLGLKRYQTASYVQVRGL